MKALVLVLLIYSILATIAFTLFAEAAKCWRHAANYWRTKYEGRYNTEGRHIPEGQGMNRSVSQRMGIFARWKHKQEVNRLCREIEGQK